MQTNISKNIGKIFSEFEKLNSVSKLLIKYGTLACSLILTAGTLLSAYSHFVLSFDLYLEFVATNIIKTSFTLLAEVIIGALAIDYLSKKV